MRALSKLFSSIKLNQIQGCEYVMVDKTSLNLAILFKLFFLGYIRGYKFDPFSVFKVFVYLKYYKGLPLLNKIKFVANTTNQLNFKISDIKKNFVSNSNFTLFTTSKGIYSALECIIINSGGFLLLSI